MTEKEAIEIIERIRDDDLLTLKAFEACTMAINALRKQIPMKMPGTYTDYKCAVCGRRIRSGKGSSSLSRDNFCQRCGQRINWDES